MLVSKVLMGSNLTVLLQTNTAEPLNLHFSGQTLYVTMVFWTEEPHIYIWAPEPG